MSNLENQNASPSIREEALKKKVVTLHDSIADNLGRRFIKYTV